MQVEAIDGQIGLLFSFMHNNIVTLEMKLKEAFRLLDDERSHESVEWTIHQILDVYTTFTKHLGRTITVIHLKQVCFYTEDFQVPDDVRIQHVLGDLLCIDQWPVPEILILWQQATASQKYFLANVYCFELIELWSTFTEQHPLLWITCDCLRYHANTEQNEYDSIDFLIPILETYSNLHDNNQEVVDECFQLLTEYTMKGNFYAYFFPKNIVKDPTCLILCSISSLVAPQTLQWIALQPNLNIECLVKLYIHSCMRYQDIANMALLKLNEAQLISLCDLSENLSDTPSTNKEIRKFIQCRQQLQMHWIHTKEFLVTCLPKHWFSYAQHLIQYDPYIVSIILQAVISFSQTLDPSRYLECVEPCCICQEAVIGVYWLCKFQHNDHVLCSSCTLQYEDIRCPVCKHEHYLVPWQNVAHP